MSAKVMHTALTSSSCSPIAIRKAAEEASMVFDEYLRMCLPEAARYTTKKAKPRTNSATKRGGILRFPENAKLRSDSGSRRPEILRRSYGNESPAVIADHSPLDELDIAVPDAIPRNVGVEVAENDEELAVNDAAQEQMYHAVAVRLTHVGDDIERDYHQQLQGFERQLMGVMRNSATSTYEIFASTLNEIIGQDRNLQEMAFVLQLSRRVISHTLNNSGTAVSYFRQFVCDAFSPAIASQGGAESFVQNENESKGETNAK